MLPVHLVQKFMEQIEGRVSLVVYASQEMLEFVRKLADISDAVGYEFVEDVEPYAAFACHRLQERQGLLPLRTEAQRT